MNYGTQLKGIEFSRLAKSLALGNNDPLAAHAYAMGQGRAWADTPSVGLHLKASVDALGTGNTSTLATPTSITASFLELVRARSVIDRIVGFRQVPANTSMLKVVSAPVGAWAGESAPKPVGAFSLERETLTPSKIVCQIVVTQELLRAAGPIADAALAHELARGVAAFADRAFVDPIYAAVAGVSPASITNGIVPISSTGASLAAVQADFQALFATFALNDGHLESAVLILAPKTALYLSMLLGTAGVSNLGPRGGTLFGIPVVTSTACLAGGSPGESFIVLLDPTQIMLADDGGVAVRVARHASIEINDAPASGATTQVSLWQNGLVAILVEREISWLRASDSAVAVLDDIQY